MHLQEQGSSSVRFFWLFLIAHVVAWTLVPSLTQPNLPVDCVEMLSWGREWELGYYKHPPLPAWICESLRLTLGQADWPIYLAAQLCVAGCFWAAWQMGRRTITPWHAVAGAVLLEGCFFYSWNTPEFNNNSSARLGWALAILFFYKALDAGKLRHWCLAGASLAVAMLSKYDAALLVASLLGFSAFHRQARSIWKSSGPYVAIAVALALFAPHGFWMIDNDLKTLQYVRERSANDWHWTNLAAHPAEFLFSQLAVLAIPLLLAASALGGKLVWRRGDAHQRFQRDYLIAVTLGPCLLAIVAAILTGARLKTAWGASMWTYVGVLALVAFEPVAAADRSHRYAVRFAALGLALAVGLGAVNVLRPYVQHKPLRVHYPGRAVAAKVERLWRRQCSQPLALVGGDTCLAGNVACYSENCPSVYIELSRDCSPWVSDSELNRRGGVIVWPLSNAAESESAKDYGCPWKDWRERFPQARLMPPLETPYETAANIAPARVGVIVVRPKGGAIANRRAAPSAPGRY